MDYSELVGCYQKLERTTKRLEMTDIISEFIRKVPEKNLPVVLLFLQGRVFPMWSEKELGIAGKLMVKALSLVSGATEDAIEKSVKETGDTGLTAEKILVRKHQTTLFTQKLTLEKVYDNLEKLAELTGKGSQDKKMSYINELLSFSTPAESKYIVRTILGELRLGVGEGIVRDAIAKSFGVDVKLLDNAYFLTSDFGELAIIAKREGNAGLKRVELKPGKPMNVMLAQKIDSIDSAIQEIEKIAFEVKYDGMRCQIHKDGKNIKLYTRRLENVTNQFPEIVKFAKEINAKTAIIEGEVVAIKNKSDRRPRPFQDLSRRIKRKYDIQKMVDEIPVEINLFDLIFLNGKSYLKEKFSERRKELEKIVKPTEFFRLADQLKTKKKSDAEKFYKKALEMGHEGVMAKNLDAPYQPGSRVGYMYKIKPVMETLDLAITGATWGEGRRSHWLGSYLLSVRDPHTGELLTIGRMATGLTDTQLEEMTEMLKPDVLEESGKEVKLKPNVVVEVAYEEIQKSPTYDSGYALRFPRLVRIRIDKGVDDADTLERVESIMKGEKR